MAIIISNHAIYYFCADANDFNSATITDIVFNADKGEDLQASLLVPIPITDDDIDEADNQFFIVQLVLNDATDRELIPVARSTSRCVIVDNDCKRTKIRIIFVKNVVYSSSNRLPIDSV